jgi:hypothetical protein
VHRAGCRSGGSCARSHVHGWGGVQSAGLQVGAWRASGAQRCSHTVVVVAGGAVVRLLRISVHLLCRAHEVPREGSGTRETSNAAPSCPPCGGRGEGSSQAAAVGGYITRCTVSCGCGGGLWCAQASDQGKGLAGLWKATRAGCMCI